MGWTFKFTKYFLRQWKGYDSKTKAVVKEKLRLVKKNPFRYERLVNYRFVFKVKLSLCGEYARLIYAVFVPDKESITVLGVFDRKVKYNDFEGLFKKMRK